MTLDRCARTADSVDVPAHGTIAIPAAPTFPVRATPTFPVRTAPTFPFGLSLSKPLTPNPPAGPSPSPALRQRFRSG